MIGIFTLPLISELFILAIYFMDISAEYLNFKIYYHKFPGADFAEGLMWVFHHTTKAPDEGFLGVGLKYLLSPRLSVRVGCGRMRPCEKSNMCYISHNSNQFIFPTLNKMSSPRRSSGLLRSKFTQ